MKLVVFLERNNLLVNFQSGFRRRRRTTDNLVYLSQKITESFNRKKKVCAIFFDISKAFDKVWHEGLVFKLIKMKVPNYIIAFVQTFLRDRSFRIALNNQLGPESPIKAGTPQGSVISPILFNIFINDIPDNSSKNRKQPLLFAVDLVTLFIFKKKTRTLQEINKYIHLLESWLIKWKMKISTSKCNYIIFSKSGAPDINISLHGELIPRTKNSTFLGITLDERLSFKDHIINIKNKCIERLKIIKILGYKSWKLKPKVLSYIYKTLVGSLIDYSFFLVNVTDNHDFHKLQVIQNKFIRYIFKLPFDCSNEIISSYEPTLNMSRLEVRLTKLSHKYIATSIINDNPIMIPLIKEYLNGFTARSIKYPTPLCTSASIFRYIPIF